MKHLRSCRPIVAFRSGAVLHLARDGDQAVLSYLPYEGEAGTGVIAECALAGITHSS